MKAILNNNDFINYKSDIDEVIKMLNGFIKYLKENYVKGVGS